MAYRWQFGTRELYARYLRLQTHTHTHTHTLRIRNTRTSWICKATTIVTRKRPNISFIRNIGALFFCRKVNEVGRRGKEPCRKFATQCPVSTNHIFRPQEIKAHFTAWDIIRHVQEDTRDHVVAKTAFRKIVNHFMISYDIFVNCKCVNTRWQ
jgi:hypothetical protein